MLIRALMEMCTPQSAFKLELKGDILVVIIHDKVRKNPFLTFWIILIMDRGT